MINCHKSNPLVSVIVPNYNHSVYLDQRLQSVLCQTYKNIEVIILDDCSTDNSLEVIEKYRSDSRIVSVVVNDINSGNTYYQWDKGIHLATGNLVWIAESDDYCEFNMLDVLVSKFLKCQSTVLAYCTPLLFNNTRTWELTPEGKDLSMLSVSYLRRFLLNMNWPMNASCCLFERKFAIRYAKRYLEIGAAGDYMFWTELLSHGGMVQIVNRHLSMWRMHEDSVTYPLMRNGKIAVNEKLIFDMICSTVKVGKLRKRYAMRYHKNRFSYFAFVSQEVQNEINKLWDFDTVDSYTFGDKVYNKVNYILRKYFNTFLSY